MIYLYISKQTHCAFLSLILHVVTLFIIIIIIVFTQKIHPLILSVFVNFYIEIVKVKKVSLSRKKNKLNKNHQINQPFLCMNQISIFPILPSILHEKKNENEEKFRSLLSRFNIIPFPFRMSCFKDIQERKFFML